MGIIKYTTINIAYNKIGQDNKGLFYYEPTTPVSNKIF